MESQNGESKLNKFLLVAAAGLLVSCGGGGSSSTNSSVSVTPPSSTNRAPVANVGAFKTDPAIGELAQYDASGSTDADGDTLSYSWDITSVPAGSAIATTYAGAMPSIKFDVVGDYALTLTVSDGTLSDTETLNVSAAAFGIKELSSFAYEKVEYNPQTDRMVLIDPDTFVYIDEAGTETEIAISHFMESLAISPDGQYAVVHGGSGGDVKATYIDLNAKTVVASYDVPETFTSLLLDNNGYMYGFPGTGQWVNVAVVDLNTGTATASNQIVRHLTQVKMHTSGTKGYGVTRDISPSQLERYDFNSGVSSVLGDGYHGEYGFCGDLWMGPDGETMLTKCQQLFHTTDTNNDMTFVKDFASSLSGISDATSSSSTMIWSILEDQGGADGNRFVKFFEHDSGDLAGEVEILDVAADLGHAVRVFASDDSDVVKVLATESDAFRTKLAVLTVYSSAYTD